MMKAYDANILAKNFKNSEIVEKRLSVIYESVKKAAESGKFSVSVTSLYGDANYAVCQRLQEAGYQVEHHSDRRDFTSWSTVSWGYAK